MPTVDAARALITPYTIDCYAMPIVHALLDLIERQEQQIGALNAVMLQKWDADFCIERLRERIEALEQEPRWPDRNRQTNT